MAKPSSRHTCKSPLVPFLLALLTGVGLLSGCAQENLASVAEPKYGIGNRLAVQRQINTYVVGCMKRRGFQYTPQELSKGHAAADYGDLLDPRKQIGSNEANVPNAMGADANDVLELAQFFGRSRQITAEAAAMDDALRGSTGTKTQVGCFELANRKYGDVSFESAKEEFLGTYKKRLQALLEDPEFRKLDRRFVSCTRSQGRAIPSMLALTPHREQELAGLVQELSPSSIGQANEALVKVLEMDARIVSSFETCIDPIRTRSLEIAKKYLRDS